MRELGVKVKRVRAKRAGAVSSQHSDAVRRKEHMEAVSMLSRRVDRIPWSRQRRKNIGLAVAITYACRSRKGYGYRGL